MPRLRWSQVEHQGSTLAQCRELPAMGVPLIRAGKVQAFVNQQPAHRFSEWARWGEDANR